MLKLFGFKFIVVTKKLDYTETESSLLGLAKSILLCLALTAGTAPFLSALRMNCTAIWRSEFFDFLLKSFISIYASV